MSGHRLQAVARERSFLSSSIFLEVASPAEVPTPSTRSLINGSSEHSHISLLSSSEYSYEKKPSQRLTVFIIAIVSTFLVTRMPKASRLANSMLVCLTRDERKRSNSSNTFTLLNDRIALNGLETMLPLSEAIQRESRYGDSPQEEQA